MTTILVAEDDQILLNATCSLFARQGYTVRAAQSGNEAIKLLKAEHDIDVIISDYYMPDGDGRQLLSYVRGGALPHRPVFILVTGQTDMSSDHIMSLGVDEFLLKPYPIRELIAIVARYLAA